jgi:hypothetical protein
MKQEDRDTRIANALAGGLVGAALGALLTEKGSGTMAAALLGAAIGASVTALEEVKEAEQPRVYLKNGKIYRVYPDGSIEYVRTIRRRPGSRDIPRNFTLE